MNAIDATTIAAKFHKEIDLMRKLREVIRYIRPVCTIYNTMYMYVVCCNNISIKRRKENGDILNFMAI